MLVLCHGSLKMRLIKRELKILKKSVSLRRWLHVTHALGWHEERDEEGRVHARARLQHAALAAALYYALHSPSAQTRALRSSPQLSGIPHHTPESFLHLFASLFPGPSGKSALRTTQERMRDSDAGLVRGHVWPDVMFYVCRNAFFYAHPSCRVDHTVYSS